MNMSSQNTTKYDIDDINNIAEEKKLFLSLIAHRSHKTLVNQRFAVLSNNLKDIKMSIQEEALSSESKEILLNKLLLLSPKKTGIFLEVFNKSKNELLDSEGIHYDALLPNNEKVEIKTSRVLITETSGTSANLYEQLISEHRNFAPFSQIFTGDYGCNIQQVKTTEFDHLNYCLFFKDVIVEFRMTKDDIKNSLISEKIQGINNFVSSHKYGKEYENYISELTSSWDSVTNFRTFHKNHVDDFKHIALETPELIDYIIQSDIISEIYKKSKLGYSDKQHKGNQGEGQFHITKDNILHHLLNNFVCSYNYFDFMSVLQGKLVDDTKQKPKLCKK